MNHLKAVIFDLDGVLTSTSDAHFAAWNTLFQHHFGQTLDPDLETKTRGVSRLESLDVLLKACGIAVNETHRQALAEAKNVIYLESIRHFDERNVFEGVEATLQFLRENDVRIALGSASRNGAELLQALKLNRYFDYVVDPAPLRGKPNPDIFLDALHHFKLDPKSCVGVEDAVAGIDAIKRAGMMAVGVGHEKLDQADLVVETFSDLDFERIDRLLEA